MDSLRNVSVRCKGFPLICYIIGCNNPATTSTKLALTDKLEVVIHVCHSCLPKFVGDIKLCKQEENVEPVTSVIESNQSNIMGDKKQ